MSTVRAPSGIPTGGQFVSATKPEVLLSLVPTSGASPAETGDFPSMRALVEEFPNRRQRLDRFNADLYALTTSPRALGTDRARAVREAVRETFEVKGRFVALGDDDGVGASYVRDALRSDHKVEQALVEVGRLDPTDASTFGDRLAGALYDIETVERAERPTPVAPEDTRVPIEVVAASAPPQGDNVTW